MPLHLCDIYCHFYKNDLSRLIVIKFIIPFPQQTWKATLKKLSEAICNAQMSALDILSSNCPHFIYYSDEIENFLMKELNATSRLFHNPGNYNEGNCEKPTPLIFQVYYRDQVMMMG